MKLFAFEHWGVGVKFHGPKAMGCLFYGEPELRTTLWKGQVFLLPDPRAEKGDFEAGIERILEAVRKWEGVGKWLM